VRMVQGKIGTGHSESEVPVGRHGATTGKHSAATGKQGTTDKQGTTGMPNTTGKPNTTGNPSTTGKRRATTQKHAVTQTQAVTQKHAVTKKHSATTRKHAIRATRAPGMPLTTPTIAVRKHGAGRPKHRVIDGSHRSSYRRLDRLAIGVIVGVVAFGVGAIGILTGLSPETNSADSTLSAATIAAGHSWAPSATPTPSTLFPYYHRDRRQVAGRFLSRSALSSGSQSVGSSGTDSSGTGSSGTGSSGKGASSAPATGTSTSGTATSLPAADASAAAIQTVAPLLLTATT
jgi:hypothetical protein